MENFKQYHWDHLHDVVLDATWTTTKTSLNQNELEELFDSLPEHIKAEARHWGLNDTVVRDHIYLWYVKNRMSNEN
jgi:hypothetical protein